MIVSFSFVLSWALLNMYSKKHDLCYNKHYCAVVTKSIFVREAILSFSSLISTFLSRVDILTELDLSFHSTCYKIYYSSIHLLKQITTIHSLNVFLTQKSVCVFLFFRTPWFPYSLGTIHSEAVIVRRPAKKVFLKLSFCKGALLKL